MILSGIPISEDACIGDSLQYINSAYLNLSARVSVAVATAPPTNIPLYIGQEHLNLNNNKF